MKSFISTVVKVAMVLSLMFAPALVPSAVNAQQGNNNAEQKICEGSGGTWKGNACSTGGPSLLEIIRAVTNILIFLVGAVAVVVIIISGFRLATSAGDAGAVKSARDGILYSVVGVFIAIAAYAIVNFVIDQIL